MITYSIIIPHKNIPHLLSRCLKSIPQREDVEVIVVDDNSDPEYLKPNVFPGMDRPDVEIVFTKEGKGAGYARNVGLRKATGKWLLFADADDYYTDGFLDVLDKYKDSDLDIVYFCIHSNKSRFSDNINNMITGYLNNPSGINDFLFLQNWQPWNKLFRRDYIMTHNFLFEEVYIGNDAMFVVKSGHFARQIGIDLFPLYNYTIRDGSLSGNDDKKLHRLALFLRLNMFYRSVNKREYLINLRPLFSDICKSKKIKPILLGLYTILKYKLREIRNRLLLISGSVCRRTLVYHGKI